MFWPKNIKKIAMRFQIVFFVLFLTFTMVRAQDDFCKVENTSFQAGEKIKYRISYNWFVVFAEVGDVTFSVSGDEYKGKPALRFVGDGRSNSWWDKFFEVRDVYTTIVNPTTLRPYFFERKVKEGGFRQYVNYAFDGSDTIAYSNYRVNDDSLKLDTISTNPCTFDVMSTLLFARSIDYSSMKKGQKIPITILLDRKLYNLYFRYQGREIVTVKKVGKFDCIKFSVMTIEGNMFHEGEDLKIWVTNDKNHIPIYIESPIQVGNVKVRIQSWEGLKHPFTSKK